jgi:hypothetical protein
MGGKLCKYYDCPTENICGTWKCTYLSLVSKQVSVLYLGGKQPTCALCPCGKLVGLGRAVGDAGCDMCA